MASLGIFRRVQPIRTVLSRNIPVQIREYRASFSLSVCVFLVVCLLLLGGGTHGGFLSDTILELIAIPVLFFALSSLMDLRIWPTRNRSDVHRALAFCCVIALLPLLQLVPLPPWIWTNLPGRQQLVTVFNLVGDQIPWMPISVSPYSTWLGFLSLLPPMAVFLLTIQLSYQDRRALSLVILAIGVISAFVGLAQVAQGPASLLRFYTVTNDTEAVGFFANRNHFAALLYAVLLLAAVWAIELSSKVKSWTDLKSVAAANLTALMAILLIIIVIIAGEAMARSRAGLALTLVALLVVFALSFTDRRNVSGGKASKIILAAIMLGIVLSMQFAVYRILGRFATDPLENARSVFAHNTITAANAFMPFGSGSGTFVPVYQLFEQPSDAIPNTFVNHAHNDILELWLETGVLGPILLSVFVIWLAIAALNMWRRPAAGMSPFDIALARAATVIIVLFLAHSFVDYPMRTEAIVAVFAVSCGFLLKPVRDGEEGVKFAASLERYLVRRTTVPKSERTLTVSIGAQQTPKPEGTVSRPGQSERWGAQVDWPEEWQKSGGQDRQTKPKSDTNDTSKVDSES